MTTPRVNYGTEFCEDAERNKTMIGTTGSIIARGADFVEAGERNKTTIATGSVTRESRHTSATTSSQRRWRLLKQNLRTASKCSNSLTVCEEALLDTLVEVRENPPVETGEDDPITTARRNLKQRIADKGDALTPAERKFLTDLAGSPNVSADYLTRSARVLFHDPLFNLLENENENEQVDTLPNAELKHASFRERGASFRAEVWTHYSPKRHIGRLDLPVESVDERKMDWEGPAKFSRRRFRCKLFKKRRKPILASSQVKVDEDDDAEVTFCILGTSACDHECQPHVLSPPMMDSLRSGLPASIKHDNFWLKYSMLRDGASLRGMLQKVRSSTRTVIAIETMEGDVFGASTSSPWRPLGPDYSGSCEAFLWRTAKSRFAKCETVEDQIRLESDLEIYSWSGNNRNIQCILSTAEHLVVGGGTSDTDPNEAGGSGFTIHFDTMCGFSEPCVTFSSPALPTVNPGDSFEIANLEVWALTPVETVQQAEQLELARQFVFDHALKRVK